MLYYISSGVEPGSKYGAVSESLRHNISEKQACVLGCKGKDCKYCNPTGPKAPWKPEDMEIKGLFSNWYVSFVVHHCFNLNQAADKMPDFNNLSLD